MTRLSDQLALIDDAVTLAVSGDDDLRVRNFGGSAEYVIDIQGYYFVPTDPE